MDKIEIIDEIINAFRFDVSPPNTSCQLINVLKHIKFDVYGENGKKDFDELYKQLIITNLFDFQTNTNKDGYSPCFRLKEESEKALHGFPKYSDYVKSEKEVKLLKEKRENEIHNANLQSSEATVDSAKSAEKSFRTTIVIGTITIIFTIYQLYRDYKKEDEIKSLHSRLDKIDSLMKIQNHIRKDTLLKKVNLKK